MSLLGTAAQAAVFVVDSDADGPDAVPGDRVCRALGSPNAAGHCTLRAAIEEANTARWDYIVVPEGTYRLTYFYHRRTGLSNSLHIGSSMFVRGSGSGRTEIDGLGGGTVLVVDPPSGSAPTIQVFLEQLAVTGGVSSSLAWRTSSGGLSVKDAIVVVRACHFFKNRGTNGGAIESDGELTLGSVVLDGNESSENGGAMYVSGPTQIFESTIADNRAAGGGGGIFANGDGYRLNLVGSDVLRNTAGAEGGGLSVSGIGTTTLARVHVLDNRGVRGGGLAAWRTPVALEDVEIAGNVAGNGGGVYLDDGLTAPNVELIELHTSVIRRSAIVENRAYFDGGGLFASTSLEIENTTIGANQADRNGGGFISVSGNVDLAFATIAMNHAAFGGAFVNESILVGSEMATGPIFFGRSIISKNDAPACGTVGDYRDPYFVFGVSNGRNVLDDSTCQTPGAPDFYPADPLLQPLDLNGGFTRNHLPAAGSPAIDVVGADECHPHEDQRGFPRPSRGLCDAGSIEGLGVQEQP